MTMIQLVGQVPPLNSMASVATHVGSGLATAFVLLLMPYMEFLHAGIALTQ